MQELQTLIKDAVKKLFDIDIDVELERPEEKFGDYSSNVAMQLGKKLDKNPLEIAENLAAEIEGANVAGPGFINITLSNQTIAKAVQSAAKLPKPYANQEILVEFGDPNPFKAMHVGHLYSYIVGESICRLLEAAGAQVKRLSYHGDVGLHIAKAVFGMKAIEHDRKNQGQTSSNPDADNVEAFMGIAYAYGSKRYDEDEHAKVEIDQINQHIYKQDDTVINSIHKRGVELSFKYFDKILDLLSISNDRRYFESETTPLGLKLVTENIGKVFIKSKGAVIFDGEEKNLHTRVFITSKDLPTYETKDLGLVELKDIDFPQAKHSIVITANEQTEYFKVMLAALAEIKPALAKKTRHLAHGFVSLSTGKMSSRSGNVLTAEDVLTHTKLAISNSFQEIDTTSKEQTMLAAVKYAFLKHRIGQDIIYQPEVSVSLEGSSGPYLQYAHARACSILAKANKTGEMNDLEPAERSLARKITEFPEVVARATEELMPHHICAYLYELAQSFNRFYESNRVVGDKREATRAALVSIYADVLASGLGLLNIEAPEKV